MPIRDDVLVIGGGLAGRMAALAASDRGASVRLVSHKESTLAQASGLVDVLGYVEDELVAEPLAALSGLPECHPYRTVGRAAVAAGLDRFDEAVGDRYAGGHTERNALVPTHGGTVKPTARYPRMTAAGLASDRRPALLVGFAALPGLDAPLAAEHLRNAGVPAPIRGTTVRFPAEVRDDAAVTHYAGLLDRDVDVTLDGRTRGARTALAEIVRPHIADAERVGFPAVLGEVRPDEVRLRLEAELGADVFEVPMGPPSLPGMRLADRLETALRDAGVAVRTGDPVVDFEADQGDVTRVSVDRSGDRVTFAAEQYVLATGGLVGTGIETDRSSVTEPVFDLHVAHPTDRYEWFADEPFGEHAFARFGVAVDAGCRALAADGEVAYGNLRAAGAIVGGADFAAEKSGSGISLATGHVAGRRAGEAA